METLYFVISECDAVYGFNIKYLKHLQNHLGMQFR